MKLNELVMIVIPRYPTSNQKHLSFSLIIFLPFLLILPFSLSSFYLLTHALKAFRKVFQPPNPVYINANKRCFTHFTFSNFFILFCVLPTNIETMSTDLHLHNDLPQLRIASAAAADAVVKTDDLPSDDDDRNAVSSVITQTETETDGATIVDVAVAVNVNVNVNDENYRTPTSKESKIPATMTCPPAPRKPKLASCKRKLLDEFQFFDVTNKEDMDAFFRSTFPKKSCTCT